MGSSACGPSSTTRGKPVSSDLDLIERLRTGSAPTMAVDLAEVLADGRRRVRRRRATAAGAVTAAAAVVAAVAIGALTADGRDRASTPPAATSVPTTRPPVA